MIDKIEKKIIQHVEGILKKEHLEYCDYLTLTTEIARLNSKEQSKKWEEEKEERNENMLNMMKNILK